MFFRNPAFLYEKVFNFAIMMQMNRNMLYPIGIQNFENIRRDGYVYVDKTALIHLDGQGICRHLRHLRK